MRGTSFDVVVIGAIGMACAYYLRSMDQGCRDAVIERGEPYAEQGIL